MTEHLPRAPAIGRRYRLFLTVVLALAAVAATSVNVSAQWPTGCVELNDIVEEHLGNTGNVGIYQRVFGEHAEGACRGDHLDDVRSVFGWALDESPTADAASPPDALETADGLAWPTTCVELNDIVERHLGNDTNVGIYQQVFGEQAERACRQDHRQDVRTTFAWAQTCDVATNASPNASTSSTHARSIPPMIDVAQTHPHLQHYLETMSWLRCMPYAWLADGVLGHDLRALDELASIARVDPELATDISEYDWFRDGVNYNDPYSSEPVALRRLGAISELSQELLAVVQSHAWIADDMNHFESGALHDLHRISTLDIDLSIEAARSPWVADGVVKYEASALADLFDLTEQDPAVARQYLQYSLQTPVRASDVYLISYIETLRSQDDNRYHQLIHQPWFQDGLDATERAAITAFTSVASDDFYRLLTSGHSQSKTITLPLTGDVTLWAFQLDPFPAGEELLDLGAEAVRWSEEFMGVAFPTNSIIYFFVGYQDIFGGRQSVGVNFEHEKIRFVREATGRFNRNSSNKNTAYHETAHYYFHSLGPEWIDEGGAEFMTAYINDRMGYQSLEIQLHDTETIAKEICAGSGLGTIYQLRRSAAGLSEAEYADDSLIVEKRRWCTYVLGEYLLLSLYFAMGKDGLAAALRELYLIESHGTVTVGEPSAKRPTDVAVFQAFLRHTPPGREHAVRDVYRRIHGGFMSDPTFAV